MRFFVLFAFLFIGCFSFSQKLTAFQQKKITDTIESLRGYNKITDSCNKYLAYDSLDNNFKARLLVNKGLALRYFLKETRDCDSLWEVKNKLFDEAITICTDCQVDFIKKKKNVLYCDKYYRNVPGIEDSILKLYGYKPDNLSPAISPQYFYGNNQWIGVEASLINALTPFFKVQDSCKGKLITYYDSKMIAGSFLSLGFKKNITNSKGWGMNFSFLSGSSRWLNIRPFNVSYLNNGNNGSFGYSPELGFQIWHLHLNSGYNFAFKKSMRSYEKFYFTAKFDIMLFPKSRF